MTLDEKIGQMTQPDQMYLADPADIEKYFLGSVLSGGDSDPKAGNSFKAWSEMAEGYQQHARKTRLKIPLVYGVDAVHGHNNVLGAVMFPHNIGLGCTRNASLVEKIARITAEEVRATGINWAFSPCVAVVQDIRWGRIYESYSEDPQLVQELGEAAVRGLQGLDLSDPISVLACAKHYAGDGGTKFGTGIGGLLDQGDTRVDEETLRRIHLPGYISAIRAGVGSIMPSYSSWNGVKCSASKRLLTEILKNELGFEGFLISDYGALDQISRDHKRAVEASINAGMDMVMVPEHYVEFIANLRALVNEGGVPMSRIDDAVSRILRVKFAMGLSGPARNKKVSRTFGTAEHRAVARQAVRESLVVLKNHRNVLPVSKNVARIHVAGKNANNLGNQCGGWTIDWQGKTGPVTPGGTTILSAIHASVPPSTRVTFSLDGSGAEGATVGVAVVGETPYAEMKGDRNNLALAPEDVTAIENMKKAGIPVVAILISGRPMIVEDVLGQVDGFIAAWLPGTEGTGVADVLFGDSKPSGKLSFSWPRSMAQLPINKNGDPGSYNPLFKFGDGLTY